MPKRVVVIPERGGGLVIRIVAGVRGGNCAGFAVGGVPTVGVAVAVGHDLSTVDVDDRADFGHGFFRAVDAEVDGQKMFAGELVGGST